MKTAVTPGPNAPREPRRNDGGGVAVARGHHPLSKTRTSARRSPGSSGYPLEWIEGRLAQVVPREGVVFPGQAGEDGSGSVDRFQRGRKEARILGVG